MKKKSKNNKKINLKKVLFITVPIFIVILIACISMYISNRNDKNGVFSILEKRWIEKNKSTKIDVSILNDLPIFGEEGDGVFFDFLNDFEKETSLEFNMIPYTTSKTAK